MYRQGIYDSNINKPPEQRKRRHYHLQGNSGSWGGNASGREADKPHIKRPAAIAESSQHKRREQYTPFRAFGGGCCLKQFGCRWHPAALDAIARNFRHLLEHGEWIYCFS